MKLNIKFIALLALTSATTTVLGPDSAAHFEFR